MTFAICFDWTTLICFSLKPHSSRNCFKSCIFFDFSSNNFSDFSFLSSWKYLLACSSKDSISDSISTIDSGVTGFSIFIFDNDSSIKSIALSGKNLFLMYLSDKVTADSIASSEISRSWCSSYLYFNPCSIFIEFSIVGSSTNTGENLLSKA